MNHNHVPMNPVFKCVITRAEESTQSDSKKVFTSYLITVSYSNRQWTIKKRYSELHRLFTRIKYQFPSKKFPFPGKKVFGNHDPV